MLISSHSVLVESQAELILARWGGGRLYQIAAFGGIVVHVSRLLAEDLLSFPPCLPASWAEDGKCKSETHRPTLQRRAFIIASANRNSGS